MASLLSSLFSWFLGIKPKEPQEDLPSVRIRVLRVPADGSAPHTLPLYTIDITKDVNTDMFLFRVPDLRAFWGQGDGWKYRDLTRFEFGSDYPSVRGVYIGYKNFALDELPLTKAAADWGIWGDAFVVKVVDEEDGEYGANYDDVPDELLNSGLYKRVLEHLAKV